MGVTAGALHHALRMGIVHRDIKPSNIMLTKDGQAKVGDFGIAKLHNQETDLTTTGMLIGTPHYMSPEQVRGETLDGRSDVFSLGSVLFELLHRRRPFPSETLTTLVYQILHEDPTAGLRDNLPAPLATLLRNMLAKNFDDRSDAGDVAREIERLLRDMLPEQLEHEAWTVEGVAAPALPPGPPGSSGAVPPPPLSPSSEATPGLPGAPPVPVLPTLESPVPESTGVPESSGAPESAGVPVTAPTMPSAPESAAVATPTPSVSSGRRVLPWVAALGCLGVLGLGTLTAGAIWWSTRDAEKPPIVGTLGEDDPLDELGAPDGDLGEAAGEDPVGVDADPSDDATDLDSTETAADDVELRVLNPADPAMPPGSSESVSDREPVTPSVRRPTSRPTPTTRPVREDPAPRPTSVSSETDEPVVAVEPVVSDEPDVAPAPTEDFSAIQVDLERDVNMAVGFRIKPDDVFVLFRRPGDTRFTNIGRSRDYDMKRKRRAAYQLPGPGPYLVILRRDGLADYRMRLNATERGEPTLIEVMLGN